jgi:hypothetical protein
LTLSQLTLESHCDEQLPMTRSVFISLLAGFAVTFGFCGGAARADLVTIEFRDQNQPTSAFPNAGGPLWRGVVNTIANTLTIFHWEEIPGSTEFWVPSLASGPLVWPAVGANGNPFDVPDTFGVTPTIGTNWGFISPISARQMVWNQGSLLLPAEADFFPGWGAVRRPIPGVNPVEMYNDTASDQRTMPVLPYNAIGLGSATNAQVRVLSVAAVAVVPEPSAFMLLGAVCTTACSALVVRRSRAKSKR